MSRFKKIFYLFLFTITCPFLLANTIPWRQKSSFHFAKEISLPELIRGYFALQNINVVIDPDVQGTVNGRFEDLSPEEFLNRLSRAHGLIWFYDGNVVYVYPSQKVESKFLAINEWASKKLLETVSGLGMVAPSSLIRIVGPNSIAFVSGPPKYVSIVSDMADRLSKNLEIEYTEIPKVKVFPLQHAWAYDTTFTTAETQITLPGLATTLRGLMQTGLPVSPDMVVSGQVRTERIQVASKIPTFLQENGLIREHNKEILPYNDYNPALLPPPPPVIDSGATLIQPDIRLNAIIVRDVEAKFPQYEAIIKALDVPVYLIEIAVAIVDINTTFSSSIGNAFFKAQNLNNPDQFITISPTTNITSGASTAGSIFNIEAGAVWDGWKIISQIEALATEGYADILARPTVLTLNNIEAEISASKTFYVQLLGTDASDLASVTAGTTMKVTPRVIESPDGGCKQIKLMINLSDGTFDSSGASGTTVTGLPITSDNTINTQAVIMEGQSLFIGGYYRQQLDVSEKGIPILKDIPWLGYLFKIRTKNNNTLERMYLITPRIVYLDYERAPEIRPQICDFVPPQMGIAHDQSKCSFDATHPECRPYDDDLDCGEQCCLPGTIKACNYFKERRYFD